MRRALATWMVGLAAAAAALAPSGAAAGTFEDALRSRWRGAWVVLGTEVYSSCSGGYDTNAVAGRLVSSRAGYRFLPGELGKVERVQLKKKKIDLMLTLEVPYRVSWQDGPFTLYEQRTCGVSLEVQLPREMTKERDVPAIDDLVAHAVRRFDTREAAFASGRWNAREVESLPEDYELTLARHAAWKAEQLNLSIDAKRQAAFEQLALAGRAIGDDPDYLQGLAAGVAALRALDVQDCGQLLARGFESARRAVPEERRADTPENGRFRRGFEDGQRLVYHITLVERLDRCYVPVPEVPQDERAAR
jgi:hypothetical protein